MSSDIEKIGIFVVLIFIGIFVWKLAIPYAGNLSGDTLKKRVNIEVLSNNPAPVTAKVKGAVLDLEIVATEVDQEAGLGGRLYLDEGTGMLFVFGKAGPHPMWMKGMIFPIGIAWLSSGFKIVHMEKNVDPSTYPNSFKSETPAKYVLEVNAGFFDANGIVVGDAFELVEEEYSL